MFVFIEISYKQEKLQEDRVLIFFPAKKSPDDARP
jgi:hypothetical protein